MDDRTSGEVVKPELEQPARRRAVPCPVTYDGIDPTWKYSIQHYFGNVKSYNGEVKRNRVSTKKQVTSDTVTVYLQ